MFYQPKFCSECGEKIVRAEWKFWHSRQFCDLCSTKHQLFDASGRFSILLVPVMIVGFAATIFVPGKGENHLESSAPPVRGFVAEGRPKEPEPKSPASSQTDLELEPQTQEVLVNGSNRGAVSKNPPSEAVYFCGAPTKKGKPAQDGLRQQAFLAT